MMLVIGPAYSGKRAWVCEALGWSNDELAKRAACDVQDLARGVSDPQALEQLAEKLAEHEVVIACELGGGVVPIEPELRTWREAAGRLSCLLAKRADVVVRICCGLPQVLKDSPDCLIQLAAPAEGEVNA